MLTLKKLKEMKSGTIFAKGEIVDSPYGINMAKMGWLKKFIDVGNGKLFAEIIAVIIIFALVLFTPLQTLDFGLKIFIMIGVIVTSVWVMRWIERTIPSNNNSIQ